MQGLVSPGSNAFVPYLPVEDGGNLKVIFVTVEIPCGWCSAHRILRQGLHFLRLAEARCWGNGAFTTQQNYNEPSTTSAACILRDRSRSAVVVETGELSPPISKKARSDPDA